MTVSVPQHDDQIIFHEGVHLYQRCGQRYVFQPFTQTLAPGCIMSVWLQCVRSNLHLESLQDVTDGMLSLWKLLVGVLEECSRGAYKCEEK